MWMPIQLHKDWMNTNVKLKKWKLLTIKIDIALPKGCSVDKKLHRKWEELWNAFPEVSKILQDWKVEWFSWVFNVGKLDSCPRPVSSFPLVIVIESWIVIFIVDESCCFLEKSHYCS